MSNSPGVVEICSIGFDSHLVISAFWCSRGTYHQVQLAGGSISALWCRRAMEHSGQLQGGHLTWVYVHSGVVGLCTTRYDDQGLGVHLTVVHLHSATCQTDLV